MRTFELISVLLFRRGSYSDEELPEPQRGGEIVGAELECPIGEAEPAHAVGEPRGHEPRLREAEAFADALQHRLVAGEHAVEHELGLPMIEEIGRHHRYVAD